MPAVARMLEPLASVCLASVYLMDSFCIERGTLLENSDLRSLEYPDQHTIHCLVDIERCTDSGYEVLTNPVESGGLYCRQFKLDGPGLEAAIALARKEGDPDAGCTTCDGGGTKEKGFRATVWGEIDESGSPAILRTVAVRSESE